MGSIALDALRRGEVHVAGIHLAHENSGAWEVPDLKSSIGDMDWIVVIFAHWVEGFISAREIPKNTDGQRYRETQTSASSTERPARVPVDSSTGKCVPAP